MAASAVPAVLRDDRAVASVELVDVAAGAESFRAVDVVVAAAETDRVREKLLRSFAAIYVELIDEPEHQGEEES
jgi:hypothetical protein